MASRASPPTYIAGVAFALLCLWAAPAMGVAGFVGIIVPGFIAHSAHTEQLPRTALLAAAITLAACVQFALLQLRVGFGWPFQALWAFVALVSAALLVSYLIDRRRDA